MKGQVLILLLFMGLAGAAFGQRPQMDFSHVDWQSVSVEAPTLDSLARKLTGGYKTEAEKVRAIFRWITENISYRTSRSSKYFVMEEWPDTVEWKSGDEMTAYQVWRRRMAVCEGFARLFKTLCTYSGITAEVVSGYARTGVASKFNVNHSWNAVRIDGNWYLLDATWASGYVTYGDEFVRHYDDHYFLTPPEQLIRTHYPEELRWSLLPDPPAVSEFHHTPFRHKSFIKYSISSYFPAKGVIEAAIGDTVRIVLEARNTERDRRISPDPFFDSSILTSSPSWVFLKPGPLVSPGKLQYTYIVGSDTPNWLHILYNDDVILRYRLNVRRREEGKEDDQ
jgi:hypothetical protein